MTSIKIKNKQLFISILIIGILYGVFHLFFHIKGLNFLTNSDAGWYYEVVNNPLAFDPAIQPLFPCITRLFIELSGHILSDYLIMNLVNFIFLIAYLIILNKIYSYLYKEYNALDVILIFSLPFFSYFMTFMPRANSMLYFIEFFVIYLTLKKQRNFLFYFLVSILPLIHKSSVFLILSLVLYDFLVKPVNYKKYFYASLPLVLYILLGFFLKHVNLFWWFKGYQENTSHFNLLAFNGIADNIYSGIFEKSLIDIAQVGLISVIYILYIYFLLRGLVKKEYEALLFYLPGLLILPLLPKTEINAFINYTYFGFLGLYIDLKKLKLFDIKPIKYLTLASISFVQLFWCLYNYTILR